MQFRFFRRTTQRRELEEEHQDGTRLEGREAGHQRRDVAPAGAEGARVTEASSEWLWWLSSSTPEGALTGGDSDREARVGRSRALDEPDEPTLPPAA
jgi:hypothetical protein